MASINYDILSVICAYCKHKNVKKINMLSKKYHHIAKYVLIYKFTENEFKYINDKYHYKIHLKHHEMPIIYSDKIVALELTHLTLTSLPDSIRILYSICHI